MQLRPARRTDLRWLAEVACDPNLTGEHNWGGEPRGVETVLAELQTDFDRGGLLESADGTLIVCLDDGTRIGDVSWRTEQWGPSSRSRCPAIGINLLPTYRGRGHGTAAQRLLVDYLFRRDPLLHRVQSDTALDNPAERRSPAKVGMVEEGIVRNAEFRNGRFHDHVLFSILRSDWNGADKAAFTTLDEEHPGAGGLG
ncbi:MAG: GNAT family protein [Actinomycetota bacterium]|nr:GNAT family protein [Actinomycetota bacterium]